MHSSDSAPPKNLCKLPWIGFSNEPNGKVRACCIYKDYIADEKQNPFFVQTHGMSEIFHSAYMQKLRQDFRENKTPSGCQTCWEDEQNGYTSKRLRHLSESDINEIIDINKHWKSEPDLYPSDYQMIISNACNLKCRSCTPSHSTSWQSELYPHIPLHERYDMPNGQSGSEQSLLWQERHKWYPNLKRLEIVGGEPFYIKQWSIILTELMDLGYSQNIMLNLSTNCTHVDKPLLLRASQNFRHVGVGLSVDGTEKVYEYLRHPAKWSLVFNNLKTYHNLYSEINSRSSEGHRLRFSLNITVSWINAWYLPELYFLVKKELPAFNVWMNLVHYPEYLSLWSAPLALKQAISHKWSQFDWGDQSQTIEGMRSFMQSRNSTPTEFSILKEKINFIDKLRSESLSSNCPEIAGFFDQ